MRQDEVGWEHIQTRLLPSYVRRLGKKTRKNIKAK